MMDLLFGWIHMSRRFALVIAAVLIIGALASWWPSWDLAVSIVPGWHIEIFSPHAVAGTIIQLVIAAVILFLQSSREKKKHGAASGSPEPKA